MVATACTVDTPTVELNQDSGTGALSADLILSSAGNQGAEILGDGLWVPSAYGVIAWRITDQAIPDNNDQAISFTDEAFTGVSGMHSTVTNNSRITCVKAGLYACKACVNFGADPDGYRLAKLIKTFVGGGTITFAQSNHLDAGSGVSTSICVAMDVELEVGDYVQLWVYHNSGATLNVNSNGHSPQLSVFRI